MLDQRNHHRLHGERQEQRDDDVDDEVFDFAQLRQQKESSTMAMAMYSSARPSHSGGLRGSPFAGNSVAISTHFVGIAALSGRSRPLVRIHMLFAFTHGSLL